MPHRLKHERTERQMTQVALSKVTGVSTRTISDIENNRGPSAPAMIRRKDGTYRRQTRTRPSTVIDIVVGLGGLRPGTYTIEQLARRQSVFSRKEFYLTAKQERELAERRRRKKSRQGKTRHLHSVA